MGSWGARTQEHLIKGAHNAEWGKEVCRHLLALCVCKYGHPQSMPLASHRMQVLQWPSCCLSETTNVSHGSSSDMAECAQVAGRRRVLLISPAYAHTGMYAFPVHHPYDRYAMPDLDRPDTAAWPLLRRARGRAAVLQPGDALFVPAYWRVPSPCLSWDDDMTM